MSKLHVYTFIFFKVIDEITLSSTTRKIIAVMKQLSYNCWNIVDTLVAVLLLVFVYNDFTVQDVPSVSIYRRCLFTGSISCKTTCLLTKIVSFKYMSFYRKSTVSIRKCQLKQVNCKYYICDHVTTLHHVMSPSSQCCVIHTKTLFCLIIMIYCTVIKLCLVKMTVCTCSLLKSQVTGIIYFVIATLTICEIKYNLPPKSTRTVTVPSPPGLWFEFLPSFE